MSYNSTGSYERFQKIEFSHIPSILRIIKSPIKEYLKSIHEIWPDKDDPSSRYLHYLLNTVYTLTNNITGGARLVTSIPYIVVEDKGGAEYGYYSIDPLIAVIGEMLSIEEPDPEQATATYRARISEILQRTFLKRTYPTPAATEAGKPVELDPARRNQPQKEPDDETIASEDDGMLDDAGLIMPEDRTGAHNLVEVLVQWRLAVDKRGTRSEAPATLARAWKRFAYSASNVEDNLRHLQTRYLGVLMHRYAVAFLNALLAESVVANTAMRNSGDMVDFSELTLNNPVTSSHIFRNNLRHVKPEAGNGRLPENALFWTVYSCPLWGFFLAPRAISEDGFNEGEVLDDQLNAWSPYAAAIGQTPRDIVRTAYTPKRRGTVPGRKAPEQLSVSFDNLFDPLNSVYIQGGAHIDRLRPLQLPPPLPPVRRGLQRIPRTPTPPTPRPTDE